MAVTKDSGVSDNIVKGPALVTPQKNKWGILPLPDKFTTKPPGSQVASQAAASTADAMARVAKAITPADVPTNQVGSAFVADRSRWFGSGSYGSSGPTKNDKAAAANLGTLAKYNAQSTMDQFDRANANYNLADTQNRQLAGVQMTQNSAKTADDRFSQLKKLQASTRGVLSSAGNAMLSSGAGNLVGMLRERQDLDTGEALGTLTQNQNAVRNALDESLNANVLARNDAASTAENQLRGIEADTAAQLNNLNPKLFVKPGTKATKLGSSKYATKHKTAANKATAAGYILP